LLREVPVPPLAVSELEPVIGPDRYARLLAAAAEFRGRLGSRAIWTVSSTAVGGGVAEMLQVLVGYAAGLEIPIRWTVIGGDPEFFATTKALHNQIHGQAGSTGMIGPAAARHYQQVLAANTVRAILATIGVLGGGPPPVPGRFTRHDGTGGEVTRAAAVTGEGRPGEADPVVVQVSRWDRLKDMPGVMRGFAEHVAPAVDGYLMLAGPEVSGVSDDPEGARVLADCLAQWRDLPAAIRARILLVTLPLDDVEENAAMINAIQRHAAVIAQKSLAEGFGLTVAEGMWKGRPVVGSAVGGILDQIADGTGVLLRDPADLAAFGSQVRWLLDDRGAAERMGRAAHAHVRDHYLGDRHLLQYAELFGAVIG
jgi:trehalose synthase